MIVFDKDRWILKALKTGYLKAFPSGVISRLTKIEINGKRVYEPIKFSTHEKTGRVYFNLTFEGVTKSVLVNRVVALAFLSNPDKSTLREVNHIDGDKANNALANLEWTSRSENEKHAFANGLKAIRGSSNSNAKLNTDAVSRIREIANSSKTPLSLIARDFGVSLATIRNIIQGKTWTHV